VHGIGFGQQRGGWRVQRSPFVAGECEAWTSALGGGARTNANTAEAAISAHYYANAKPAMIRKSTPPAR
jgi:hypothetical protein